MRKDYNAIQISGERSSQGENKFFHKKKVENKFPHSFFLQCFLFNELASPSTHGPEVNKFLRDFRS